MSRRRGGAGVHEFDLFPRRRRPAAAAQRRRRRRAPAGHHRPAGKSDPPRRRRRRRRHRHRSARRHHRRRQAFPGPLAGAKPAPRQSRARRASHLLPDRRGPRPAGSAAWRRRLLVLLRVGPRPSRRGRGGSAGFGGGTSTAAIPPLRPGSLSARRPRRRLSLLRARPAHHHGDRAARIESVQHLELQASAAAVARVVKSSSRSLGRPPWRGSPPAPPPGTSPPRHRYANARTHFCLVLEGPPSSTGFSRRARAASFITQTSRSSLRFDPPRNRLSHLSSRPEDAARGSRTLHTRVAQGRDAHAKLSSEAERPSSA